METENQNLEQGAPSTTPNPTTGKKKKYDDRVVEDFDNMGLKKELLHGIYSYGFEKPSVIQQKCILPITTSEPPSDVIGQAQSGTGKTATFTIAMLQRIDETKPTVQAIVLAPTRELAIQTHNVVVKIGVHMGIKAHACVGGTSVQDDKAKLQNGVQIVVGTPGRITHMMEEDILKVDDLKLIVIDEADEMLSQDFKTQLYEIFQHFPENVQICLFSATMPQETFEITQKFMRDPITVLVKKEALTLEGIKQFYIDVREERFKYDVILDLYKTAQITQCVIFLNSRKRVDWLARKMDEENYTVAKIHSGISHAERVKTMNEFKQGTSRVLIATDLIARGIDAHHVSLVINFDLPKDKESYLHRIGRSGRYGRKGVSINFITNRDRDIQKALESYYATVINPLPNNFAEHL